ncbi:MAG: hypothetical protein GC158_07410 [Cyanobacteria bacterium RI_101]|nr:hypothetical protein [Cyanobacteria bacterium RI_101]
MALKSWIFLLQSAKDLSWRSLGPGVIVPPGVYRLSLQSPKPNRAIEVRLRYAPGEGDPIIRRYSLESDALGHLPILGPLDFEAGQWEIDCRPDVFTALSGEDWRESLRFEIGEAEQISQVSDIRYQTSEDGEQPTASELEQPERRRAFLTDLPEIEELTDVELQIPKRRSVFPTELPTSLTLEAPAEQISDIRYQISEDELEKPARRSAFPTELPTSLTLEAPGVETVEVPPTPAPESLAAEQPPACRLVNYVLQLDDLEKQRRFTVDITLWEDLSRRALPLELPLPQAQNSLPYRTVPCPNHILPPKLRPRPNGAGQPRLKLPQL